ncbi:MAG: hypothetical protein ACK559_41830, partial [bacterium]
VLQQAGDGGGFGLLQRGQQAGEGVVDAGGALRVHQVGLAAAVRVAGGADEAVEVRAPGDAGLGAGEADAVHQEGGALALGVAGQRGTVAFVEVAVGLLAVFGGAGRERGGGQEPEGAAHQRSRTERPSVVYVSPAPQDVALRPIARSSVSVTLPTFSSVYER